MLSLQEPNNGSLGAEFSSDKWIISILNEEILIASNVNSINLNTVYGIQIPNLIFMLCLVNLLSVQMMLDAGC